MTTDEIRSRLFAMQDVKYRDFQGGLIPGMNPENMIGVRTPELRKLAKEVGAERVYLNQPLMPPASHGRAGCCAGRDSTPPSARLWIWAFEPYPAL